MHEIALNPLINGVSFWENPHAVFSPGLSPDVIDTANVMTGGFSAEYGNRFGGVVDIVTKSGLRMGEQRLRRRSTAAGRTAECSCGEIGGRRERFGYYVFGSVFESDRFLSPPDPEAIHDSGRGGHVFVQLDANLGRAGSLRVVLMGDGANFEIPRRRWTSSCARWRTPSSAPANRRPLSAGLARFDDLALGASFYQRWSRSQLHARPPAP